MNYQIEMEKILSNIKNKPKLLLHACCAPCSSYVLECLSKYFEITIYYYNPNIYPVNEYIRRKNELEKFLINANYNNIKLVIEDYDDNDYYDEVKGLENYKEGSERCFKCYEFRLRKSIEYALKFNFDYFTTTLSISPYKNSSKLNEIGLKLQDKYKIKYLVSDFKKKNGYKRSLELSKQYNLYRQDYCGCIYSLNNKKST